MESLRFVELFRLDSIPVGDQGAPRWIVVDGVLVTSRLFGVPLRPLGGLVLEGACSKVSSSCALGVEAGAILVAHGCYPWPPQSSLQMLWLILVHYFWC